MSTNLLMQFTQALSQKTIRVIDLTQPLQASTPILPLPPDFGQSWPFRLEEISRYDERGPGWYWNNFSCGEHTGTHFDAPIHWVTGKDHAHNATDSIPVDKFIAPACVIDVTEEAGRDADFLLTCEHVERWEAQHGRIPEGSWVLMRTGWSRHGASSAYLNLREDGSHVPGPHPELPEWLARERNVIGWGSEGVGTDAGQAFSFETPFPCHCHMHGANKFGLASLANLDQLPPTGAVLITPPLKIVNGSGSPCRVLALVEG
ncbi:cyclase family protein [Telluria beijingensis]|uniref:cyclase family protein n=1 Tax=Telluria beijingensis TaxID=3068633 RepID=UPI002795BF46|nr:cyclase family protein [Massilia sp. REN29]